MRREDAPPGPAGAPIDEALARRWWPYCERWAAAQERSTGCDLGPAALEALWRAATGYDPARGAFAARLKVALRYALLRDPPAQQARRARGRGLARVPLVDVPLPPRPDDADGGDPAAAIPLGVLTPRQRGVIEALYDRDLTPAAAARELGTTKGAVIEARRRALARLRAALESGPQEKETAP
jgi:DNA-directed RNA polymerase specialized sigma24 family protein